MEVNRVSGSDQPSHFIPPLVQEFYTVWQNWYQEPTHHTGEKLLHFLKHHEAELTNIVGNTKEPFGSHFNETFSELYANTLNIVSTWVHHCKKGNTPITSPVSELITYIYDWAMAACRS
jgi:hypothetical protein